MSQQFNGFNGMPYNMRQQKPKEPEITDQQMFEFEREYDNLTIERNQKDVEIKREKHTTEQIVKSKFEEFVNTMGPCKCDGSMMERSRRDLRVVNFIAKREKDTDGTQAIRTLELWAANDLKNPHVEKVFVGLFSSPYMVEYRELNGKKWVKVSLEKSGKKTKCLQEFYIREDGL